MKIRIFETYDWTGDYIDVEATSARVTRQLMSRDEIAITVEANAVIDFKIGMCVRDVGTPLFSYYFLNELPAYEKRAWNEHVYTLTFKAPMHDLDLVSFLSADGETDFYYSGRASDFVNLILSNMSRGRVAWVAGTSDVTEYRNIQFSSLTCWGALQLIADEFDLEFDIQEVPASEPMQCSIALVSKVQYAGSLELYVGPEGGIYNLKRTSVDYDKLVTRLYYRGSDRNLPPSYAYEKLRGSANYIEANVSLFGLKEGVKVFDEVFPHYEGVVTGFEIAADGKQYLTDSSFPFDLKEEIDGTSTYLIAGTTAKINFLTGNCAGLTLDIADYKHATKQFRLIVFKDERGYEQPNATVQPAAGDKYVIFDIKMPTVYVTNAVTALDAAAAAHLAEVSTPRVAYTLETGVKWASALGVILQPATEIAITDVDLSLTEACRVVEVSYSLFDPYKATAKLSDVRFPVPGRAVVNLLKDVNKVIKVSKANQVERFQKNMKTTNELKSLTFDPQDEKFLPENTRVESVDPVTLALDSGEIQFHLEGVEFTPNFEDNPNALHVSAGTFVHHSANAKYRSEIEAIQAAGGVYTPFRSWNIPGTTFSLSAGEQHIYAKVHSSSDSFGTPYTDAEIVLSSVPLWAKKDVGYTYFRIGSISDVDAETDTRATKTLWPKVEKSAPGAKNFIELEDAESVYPEHGNVVKGAADGVPFAENLGDDGAVWVRSQLSETLGANLGFTSSTALEAGKTYQIAVLISGRTVGSVAIKINSATIATVTQTSFIAYTASTTGAHNCEAVASVDFDGTISLITIKEVIAVTRKGLKFVDGAHGTIAELLAFADNLAWGANMPGDFAGKGNIYIGASPETGDESNKVRLAEMLYDRNLKILSLPTSGEFRADKMGVGLINPITFDRTIDSRVRIYAASTQIANLNTAGHVELYANPRIKTSGTAPSEVFTEVYLNPLYDTSIQAAALGQVATITAGVGGLKTVTWAAISGLLPSASNGDILYYNGGWQKLAKGADGQVLTLAASLPSWADASSGGSCLWTQTANGARIDQPAGVFGQAPAGTRLYVGTWTGVAPSVFFQALTNAAHDMFVIETFSGLRTRFIYNGNVVFPANIDCAKFSLGGKNIFTTQKTLTISATGNFNYMSCSSTDYVLNLTGSPSTAMLRIDNSGSARPIDYFNSSNQNRFWVDETGAVFADSMYCRRTGYTSFGVNIIGEANFAKVTSRQIYISAGYLLGIDVGGVYRTIINSDGSVTPWAGVSGTFTSSDGKTITIAKGMVISIA